MQGLSPALRQLVNATTADSRPTHADRQRVLNRIRARLALAEGIAATAPGASVAGNRSDVSALRVATKVSVGAAIIVSGVALLHWLSPQPLNVSETFFAAVGGTVTPFTEVSAVPEPSEQRDTTEAATLDKTAVSARSSIEGYYRP